MDSHDVENYFRHHRKTLAVIFLMVGMLAVSGFFMGMRQTERQPSRSRNGSGGPPPAAPADIPTAPKYGEISGSQWHANRNWKFSLTDLPKAQPAPTDLPVATPAERAAAVTARKSLRAYDGAPPVIPHAVDTIRSAACASCHGQGSNVVIGDKRPAEISHPWITNCTSCHVPADGLRQLAAPAEARLVVPNDFTGRESSGSGQRFYGSAPPTMPHPVWMRQNCMACHGPGRDQAIRTSHPQRKNCLQCHAPNSAFDNRETYLTIPKPSAPALPPGKP